MHPRPFLEDLREPLPKENCPAGWPPVEILSVMLALIGVFGLWILRGRSSNRKLPLNYFPFLPKDR